MIDDNLFLFIEPKKAPAESPIIDDITKKITYYFRESVRGYKCGKDHAKEGKRWSETLIPDKFLIVDLPWNEKYNFMIGFTGYKGYHSCTFCGGSVCAEQNEFLIETGQITNSLCIHYVAFHREEIPQDQLDTINSWWKCNISDIVPSQSELNGKLRSYVKVR